MPVLKILHDKKVPTFSGYTHLLLYLRHQQIVNSRTIKTMPLLLPSRKLSSLIRLSQRKAVALSSCFSSSSSSECDGLVLSSVDEDAGVATLIMNRPPANSLNLQM